MDAIIQFLLAFNLFIKCKIGMGQTLWCFDCCWFAQFHCVGCSYALFCCSCWVCMPDNVKAFRPDGCCLTGCNQGYGYTAICYGGYCCIPQWFISYSIREQIGTKRPNLGDLQLMEVSGQHNQTAGLMMQQQNMNMNYRAY